MPAVVTQLSLLSPFGMGTEVFSQALRTQKNAFGTVAAFPSHNLCSQLAAEVQIPRMAEVPRATQLLNQTLTNIWTRRGMEPSVRRAVILASTKGELEKTLNRQSQDPLSGLLARTATFLEANSACYAVSAACASSTQAVADATALIEDGICDEAVVVGLEGLHEFVYQGFHSLKALSAEGARPFDLKRTGLTLGEGCAIIELQSETRALKTKSKSLGRIMGYGSSADAHDQTAPHPQAAGLILAVRTALEKAKISAQQVDRYHAHGTATWHNDQAEAAMCRDVFSGRRMAVTGIKGNIGHTLGAAGAFDVAACLLSMNEGQLWGVANTQKVNEALGIEVCLQTRACRDQIAVIGTAGFGGLNVALVVQKQGADHGD